MSDTVDEDRLINNIPPSFLPVSSKLCLITVETVIEGKVNGSHAPDHAGKFFRFWAKYFDAYVVELAAEEVVNASE